MGGYLAFTIPVAVFPSTNFPRVIIGVDNGVMPIDQMMVTITRPLEEAINSVQGLQTVQSITSRGSAEIDLYFDWNVDMFETLQRVNSAVATVQTSLPSTVQIETHRLTFASFPIIGYSLTSDTAPQTDLWEMATYEIKPRLNRLDGVSTVLVQGGEEPEFQISPNPAKLLETHVTVTDILDAVRRTNLIDSPGLLERNHQLYLGIGERAGPHAGRNCEYRRQVDERWRARPHPGSGDGEPVGKARLHDRHRGYQARCAAQYQPSAGEQYGGGGARGA